MWYEGLRRIIEMEQWDQEYCNMEVQAFIRIGSNGIGEFQFALVSGELDGEVVKVGDAERFEFTREGQDELDPALGSGWLQLAGRDQLKGRIKIHMGDSSGLVAVRALG